MTMLQCLDYRVAMYDVEQTSPQLSHSNEPTSTQLRWPAWAWLFLVELSVEPVPGPC